MKVTKWLVIGIMVSLLGVIESQAYTVATGTRTFTETYAVSKDVAKPSIEEDKFNAECEMLRKAEAERIYERLQRQRAIERVFEKERKGDRLGRKIIGATLTAVGYVLAKDGFTEIKTKWYRYKTISVLHEGEPSSWDVIPGVTIPGVTIPKVELTNLVWSAFLPYSWDTRDWRIQASMDIKNTGNVRIKGVTMKFNAFDGLGQIPGNGEYNTTLYDFDFKYSDIGVGKTVNSEYNYRGQPRMWMLTRRPTRFTVDLTILEHGTASSTYIPGTSTYIPGTPDTYTYEVERVSHERKEFKNMTQGYIGAGLMLFGIWEFVRPDYKGEYSLSVIPNNDNIKVAFNKKF